MGTAAPLPTAPAAAFTLLLPRRERIEGVAPLLERVLARGDRQSLGVGDEAQLQRAFDILPRGLPVAALTREFDRGDALSHSWLRADPASVRADLGAGRLLACGDLGLSEDEVEQLLQPLKPLFGDDGCPISAGAPSRWYLALPRDSRLPAFMPPSRALGDDIFLHLPEGDLGRRWRRLLSEAQVILHNHPVNIARSAAGQLPVNSLWFWGGGTLPDHVRGSYAGVASDDLLIAALARAATLPARELPASLSALGEARGLLLDLRRLRDANGLQQAWLAPALARLRGGADRLRLDFADGTLVDYRRGHRWRFWRRVPAVAG